MKIEYSVIETEFNPARKVEFNVFLDIQGQEGWNLVNFIPLQTVTGNLSLPDRQSIKLTFLCIFKRRKL